jgi:hypothetical protein
MGSKHTPPPGEHFLVACWVQQHPDPNPILPEPRYLHLHCQRPLSLTPLLLHLQAADISNPSAPPIELADVQEQYNHLAIQLSFLVACMYTAVGALRLGFLTNFLSHAVVSGFTSGATIIIGLSQVSRQQLSSSSGGTASVMLGQQF